MKRIFYSLVSSKNLVVLFLAGALMFSLSTLAQPYTIQFPNPPPATNDPSLDRNDDPAHGIIFGVKFYVTRPGYVIAIRYYRGDAVTGTHEGWLWNKNRAKDTFLLPSTPACSRGWCGPGPGGQLNATAAMFPPVVPGPGTGGWQQALLPTPIHITPVDTFVASIWSGSGDYAVEGWPGPTNTWGGGGAPGTDYGSDPNPIRVLAVLNDPSGYPTGNGVYLLGTPENPNAADNTNNFPIFSNFAPNYWVDILFNPDGSLPVSLTDLRAATTNKDIVLTWKTESEQNNRGFEIQRSNNGTDWYPITFVNGAGQSTSPRNYTYTDKGLAPGSYHYRLNQKDLDGKSKISSTVTAAVSGKGQVLLFQNYPNPFNGTTSIRFDLPKTQKIKLSVFDITGREVKVLADKLSEAGSHQITFDATLLKRQQYLVKLQTETEVLTKKILVQ